MKRIIIISVVICSLTILGCSGNTELPQEQTEEKPTPTLEIVAEDDSMQEEILLIVNDTTLNVSWENNESVEALKEMLREETVTINTERYGGFEQVGRLPQSIIRNDIQMTANAGDIVLYSGNSLVLFFGVNTWTYTKLGHINDLSSDELETLLSGENATITLSMSN